MSQTRIYVVKKNAETGKECEVRLVEAASAAQAIRFCATGLFDAEVATTKTVAQFMGEGKKLETATVEQ